MKIIALMASIQIFLCSSFLGGFQSKLIYYPINQEIRNIWIDIKQDIQDTYFFSRDGIRLNGWYVKAEPGKPTVIYCHGQGENISLWQNVIKFLADRGYGVFMLDYRGHGRSEGKPFESGLYVDLESAIHYLKVYEGVQQEEIILWGRSLGGAVVADVASRKQFKAVILESTFTNIREEAIHLTRNGVLENKWAIWRKVSSFFVKNYPITQKFQTDKKIQMIESPLLIGHSLHDQTVPVDMSYKLCELNPKAESYFCKCGSHHENDWFFEKILDFIKNIKTEATPDQVSNPAPPANKRA